MKENFIAFLAVIFCGCTFYIFNSFAYTVPGTGITKCYNNSQEISCPSVGQSFYGQDGNFQANQMSYIDNGNGTVTDLVTGLLWQQASDSTQRSLSEATQYCTSLTLGGLSGWRLPSMKEFTTLVDASKNSPALDTSTFSCPSCYTFWSSTTSYVSSINWVINFTDGMTSFDFGNADYVRCVHGNQLQ